MVHRAAVLTLLMLGLAGCDTPPQPPSPAMMQLMGACQGGNIQACSTIEQIRSQQAIAYQQSVSAQLSRPQAPIYQPRYSMCNPNYYNSAVSCINY